MRARVRSRRRLIQSVRARPIRSADLVISALVGIERRLDARCLAAAYIVSAVT
jgi:hypothetical protein